jgi:hypothetical protein
MRRAANHSPPARELRDALLKLLYKSENHALWAPETYQPLAKKFGVKNDESWQRRVCSTRLALRTKRLLCRRAHNRHWILTGQGKNQAERLAGTTTRQPSEPRTPTSATSRGRPIPGSTAHGSSPLFKLETVRVRASARESDDGFVVLAGSMARRDETASLRQSDRRRRNRLVKDNQLVDGSEPGSYLFAANVPFQSPTAAACVVAGRSMNGAEVWKVSGTDISYRDWQADRRGA